MMLRVLRVAPYTYSALSLGYLLLLTAAAPFARYRRARIVPPREPVELVIVIPAHDEERDLPRLLSSIAAAATEAAGWADASVVVIADNCTDETAAVGRDAGASVLEREAPELRGKGHALAWALPEVLEQHPTARAVAIVDADCVVSRSFLRAVAAALARGERAVQTDDVVANPDASPVAALRYAAFRLMVTVRASGRDALGLSCGLHGTGMVFARTVLEEVPWDAAALQEDSEYHARLVLAGCRVAFEGGASVASAMPLTHEESRSQHARWEGGQIELARRWSPRLLRAGVRRRDPALLAAGLDPLIAPQSLLAGGNVALLMYAFVGWARARPLAIALVAAHALYVFAGLLVVGAPAAVYRAFLHAPGLAVRKIALYVDLVVRGGPSGWTRSSRASAGSA